LISNPENVIFTEAREVVTDVTAEVVTDAETGMDEDAVTDVVQEMERDATEAIETERVQATAVAVMASLDQIIVECVTHQECIRRHQPISSEEMQDPGQRSLA
jgi:hypothetical protein